MKKTIALVLCIVLMVTACSAAFAACKFNYCNAEIAGTTLAGFSDVKTYTHKYGGFLGLFQGTCTVSYQDAYMETYCANGHLQGTSTFKGPESHSSCGQ